MLKYFENVKRRKSESEFNEFVPRLIEYNFKWNQPLLRFKFKPWLKFFKFSLWNDNFRKDNSEKQLPNIENSEKDEISILISLVSLGQANDWAKGLKDMQEGIRALQLGEWVWPSNCSSPALTWQFLTKKTWDSLISLCCMPVPLLESIQDWNTLINQSINYNQSFLINQSINQSIIQP